MLLDQVRGDGNLLVFRGLRNADVDDGAIARRIEGRRVSIAAVEHEAHRFCRTAAARLPRRAIPKRKEHMAVRRHVDSRLPIAIIAPRLLGFARWNYEHLISTREQTLERLELLVREVVTVLIELER